MTNYWYFLLYKRLSRRFSLATIERHWGRIYAIVPCKRRCERLLDGYCARCHEACYP